MRSSLRRVWWAVAAGAALFLSPGIVRAGQQTLESPAPGNRLLRLEVVVTGPDGRPVRGLTRDDFDVFDRGVRRPMGTFMEVDGQSDAASTLPRPMAAGLAIATNTHVDADRLAILVLDDRGADAGQLRALREAARRVLETLAADVPVGIIRASGEAGVELTRDPDQLATALGWLGTGSPSRAVADREVFEAMADAASLLQGPSGRHRMFVWVAGQASHDPDVSTGPQAQRFLQASREAGARLFVVDDTGTTSLRDLAERTGGGVVALGTLDAVAARLATEREHQYRLGLPLGNGDDDGSGIEVRVRRAGAVARHRLGPLGLPADRPPASRELTTPSTRVVPDAGLPLRLLAAAGPDGGRDARVMVAFEMRVPRAPLEAVDPRLLDEVEFELAAFDVHSDRVTRRREATEVAALRPRNGRSPVGPGEVTFEVVSSIELPPGDYQLRVVARSRTLERAGSVYLSLRVPDFERSAVGIGGLILGYVPPEGEAGDAIRDPNLEPGQQLRMLRPTFGGGGTGLAAVVATSGRGQALVPAFEPRFERWDPVRLRFEVSQQPPRAGTSALVEVVDAAGRTVHTSQPTVEARSRSAIDVDLPLARLAPGAYRVRVRVTRGSDVVEREVALVVDGVPVAEEPGAPAGTTPAGIGAAGEPAGSAGPGTRPAEVPVSGPPPPDASATAVRMRPDVGLGEPGRGSDAEALASEGWERYGRGDVEGAQAKLAAAVEAGTRSPWIHYARGLAEFALGRFEVAAASWEVVREMLPDYETVYFDLTDAYLSLDRPDAARDVLRDAVERWPGDPEVHNAMGVVLFGRRELDGAIRSFQRAIDAAPEDGLGYFNLGRAYQARMMRWRASRTVQMASAVDTLAERDRQHAVEAFTRALELGGSFDWEAREALRVLVRAP